MLFSIDGTVVKTPSDWEINNKITSIDSMRIPETLELVQNMKGTLYEIKWTYKHLTQEEYDAIYNLYIENTIQSNDPNHTLITCDHNSNNIFEFDIYTQSDFVSRLYRINHLTGNREYRDVTFVFVSRTTRRENKGTWSWNDIRDSRDNVQNSEN